MTDDPNVKATGAEMPCPKCGKSIKVGAVLCRFCKATLAVPSASSPPAPEHSKTGTVDGLLKNPAKLAQASLILGGASLLCSCLTAIPGIIMGILALQRTAPGQANQRTKLSAVGGIALSGFFILFWLFWSVVVLISPSSRGDAALPNYPKKFHTLEERHTVYSGFESADKSLELPEGCLVVPIQVKLSGRDVWVEVAYDTAYDRRKRKYGDRKGWLRNPSMHESTEEEMTGKPK